MKTLLVLLAVFFGVSFLANASARQYSVLNSALKTIELKLSNGKTYKMGGSICYKLEKSDFPIHVNGHRCSKPDDYSISHFFGLHCTKEVIPDDLCQKLPGR